MGYRVPKTSVRVDFPAGHQYHGAEVVLTLDLTIDQALELEKLQTSRDIGALYDAMGELLLEWNLEDDQGRPLNPSPENLRSQPTPFLAAVFSAYGRALGEATNVPGPSEGRSNDGGMSASPN